MPLHGSPPLLSGIDAFFGQFSILFWAAAIEFTGGLIIVCYVLAAIWTLIRRQGVNHGITKARVLVAEGAVWGLSFKVAATLLKTLTIQTWAQFGIFIFVFILRFVVKKVFAGEEARLGGQMAARRGLSSTNQGPRPGLTDLGIMTTQENAHPPIHVRLRQGFPQWWQSARTHIEEIGRSLRV